MPREIPRCPPERPKRAACEEWTFDIELITPMFGGGVEPRVNDESFPIRPTAIRGQLQFWWRATVGAQYGTPEELRREQAAIWGSTERASEVQVLVRKLEAGAATRCAQFSWNQAARKGSGAWRLNWESPFSGRDSALPYALFPFQGELPAPEQDSTATAQPSKCIHRASFQLVLKCPTELWSRVEPAVWAWVNLGGLGSRTRRGCGAIRCPQLSSTDRADLVSRLKQYLQTSFPLRRWPTLAANALVGTDDSTSLAAWNHVINLLKQFRQGVALGRNPGQQPSRPGRSRYPEAETIRTVLWDPVRSWEHDRLQHIPNDAFPRAEFGLPIVFHFQSQSEPCDTVLYPSADSDGKKRERMASPLILKPVALGNGKAVPLIVQLRTDHPSKVDLRIKKKHFSSLPRALAESVRRTTKPDDDEGSLPLPESTAVANPRLAEYPESPLNRSESGSAIESFLAYAADRGFREVTP